MSHADWRAQVAPARSPLAPVMVQTAPEKMSQATGKKEPASRAAAALTAFGTAVLALEPAKAWVFFSELRGDGAHNLFGAAVRFLAATPAERGEQIEDVLSLGALLPEPVSTHASNAYNAITTVRQSELERLAVQHSKALVRVAELAVAAVDWCGRMAGVEWHAATEAHAREHTAETRARLDSVAQLAVFAASVAVRRQATRAKASAKAWAKAFVRDATPLATPVYARLRMMLESSSQPSPALSEHPVVAEWVAAKDTPGTRPDEAARAATRTLRALLRGDPANREAAAGPWLEAVACTVSPDALTHATAAYHRAVVMGDAEGPRSAAAEDLLASVARRLLAHEGTTTGAGADATADKTLLARTLEEFTTLRAYVDARIDGHARESGPGEIARTARIFSTMFAAGIDGDADTEAAAREAARILGAPAEHVLAARAATRRALLAASAQVLTSIASAAVDGGGPVAERSVGADADNLPLSPEAAAMAAAQRSARAERLDRERRLVLRRIIEAEEPPVPPELIESKIDEMLRDQRRALAPGNTVLPRYSRLWVWQAGFMFLFLGFLVAAWGVGVAAQRSRNESSRAVVGHEVEARPLLQQTLQLARTRERRAAATAATAALSEPASVFELNVLRDDALALEARFKSADDDELDYDDVLRELEPYCRLLQPADFGSDGAAWAHQCNVLRTDTLDRAAFTKQQRAAPPAHRVTTWGNSLTESVRGLANGIAAIGKRADQTARPPAAGAATAAGAAAGTPTAAAASSTDALQTVHATELADTDARAASMDELVAAAGTRFTVAMAESDALARTLYGRDVPAAYREYALQKLIVHRNSLRRRAVEIDVLYRRWQRESASHASTQRMLADESLRDTVDGATELDVALRYAALTDELDAALLRLPEPPVLRTLPEPGRVAAWSDKGVLGDCARTLATLLNKHVGLQVDAIYGMPEVQRLGVRTRKAMQRGWMELLLRKTGLSTDDALGGLWTHMLVFTTTGVRTGLLAWLYVNVAPLLVYPLVVGASARLAWHGTTLVDRLVGARADQRAGVGSAFAHELWNDIRNVAAFVTVSGSVVMGVLLQDGSSVAAAAGGVAANVGGAAARAAVGLAADASEQGATRAIDAPRCAVCGSAAAFKCCAGGVYCGVACQASAWERHAARCAASL